jgi:hypothetical protein
MNSKQAIPHLASPRRLSAGALAGVAFLILGSTLSAQFEGIGLPELAKTEPAPDHFRLEKPIEVKNQSGQAMLLVGMEGASAVFQFAGQAGAEATIPITDDETTVLTFPFPKNYGKIQLDALNGDFDRVVRSLRASVTPLLNFVHLPGNASNFNQISEVYYRSIASAAAPKLATRATAAIRWQSPNIPPVFKQHVAVLVTRLLEEGEIQAVGEIINLLHASLPFDEFSTIALPVADRLRTVGEIELMERIYGSLCRSKDSDVARLGQLWAAYSLSSSGRPAESQRLLDRVGDITEGSELFPIFCLAQGQLGLAEENYIKALRFISRAMVQTTLEDSFKPEMYYLMIKTYMEVDETAPAGLLSREMAVFYPNSPWRKAVVENFPNLAGSGSEPAAR